MGWKKDRLGLEKKTVWGCRDLFFSFCRDSQKRHKMLIYTRAQLQRKKHILDFTLLNLLSLYFMSESLLTI